MTIILGLALGLIVVGIVMAVLADKLGNALLTTVVWWVGIVLIVIGLILLVSPVILWINGHLRQMLGQ
jgi:hypothetical protein